MLLETCDFALGEWPMLLGWLYSVAGCYAITQNEQRLAG